MRTGFALLRGVCQIPAYAAYEKGFFAATGGTGNRLERVLERPL